MFESESATPPKSSPGTSRREARTEAILRAALEELAESGFSAFSYEAVAARVGIAKTTVYRRYPTKIDLIRAAVLQSMNDALGVPPDTGSLRGDIIAVGRQIVQLCSSVLGQCMFRIRLLDRAAPELDAMGREFEAERNALDRVAAARAIARGELSSEEDYSAIMRVISGAIIVKQVLQRQTVDELEIARIADMLLNGVSKPQGHSHRASRG